MTTSGKRGDSANVERYYPVSAVARWLGVTEVSIKNWTNAGRLDAIRTAGGHRRITASSVVAMLEAQGRSVPRELADARPFVLLVMRPRDELVKHLRRVMGTGARIELVSDGYVAAMTAVRMRPRVMIVDVALPDLDAERWMDAVRAEPTLRSVTALLVGDGARGRTVPPANEGEGPTHFFQRREHEAIAAAAGALVRQLATA
jgi:excisionase family DNA binding protein